MRNEHAHTEASSMKSRFTLYSCAVLVSCTIALISSELALAADPAPLQNYVDTTYVPPTGKTITVNAGGNLQTAINSALPGDVVVVQAGATFTGNFTLPAKTGS